MEGCVEYETIYARRPWPRRSPTIIGLGLRYPALMSLGKTFHRHVYLEIRGIWLTPNGRKGFGANFIEDKIFEHEDLCPQKYKEPTPAATTTDTGINANIDNLRKREALFFCFIVSVQVPWPYWHKSRKRRK